MRTYKHYRNCIRYQGQAAPVRRAKVGMVWAGYHEIHACLTAVCFDSASFRALYGGREAEGERDRTLELRAAGDEFAIVWPHENDVDSTLTIYPDIVTARKVFERQVRSYADDSRWRVIHASIG